MPGCFILSSRPSRSSRKFLLQKADARFPVFYAACWSCSSVCIGVHPWLMQLPHTGLRSIFPKKQGRTAFVQGWPADCARMLESNTSSNHGSGLAGETKSPIPTPHSAINDGSVPSHPFPRLPGETPRAYGAFVAFFDLGQTRSLPAVAEKVGEGLATVKNWSSKYSWSERIQNFNAGVLQLQADGIAEVRRKQAVDWAQRLAQFREQQWEVSQKLAAVAQCFLESFGDENLSQMTLGQASRASHLFRSRPVCSHRNRTAGGC